MNARDIQFFLDHLRVGNAYEISKFHVVHNRTSSKVVPKQWFNLIDFDQLRRRINNDVELTGGKQLGSPYGEKLQRVLRTAECNHFYHPYSSLKVKEYKGNPVLGSTGSTVCVFNLDIPQLSQYKQK
ncbi:hypothetical protein DVH24_015713 [Malus domestica]|uniref:Uncharacterized protein n=1 Tax=Malus domestica TaxID=3750 RepID=A0A498HPJ0_MALDO|nr:hypothetical protein DVH24_015713 [Malus domestica]